MGETTVRVLDESDWALYRDVRLQALTESPDSFSATLADEADRDEQYWRERMARSARLLAERDGVPQGVVSLGTSGADEPAAEVYGLYVVPEARGTGAGWRLVQAATDLATRKDFEQAYFWVGTDNPRAIGFANNFGFRVTGYRRPARAADLNLGDEEMAMVLPLRPDKTSSPNANSDVTARSNFSS